VIAWGGVSLLAALTLGLAGCLNDEDGDRLIRAPWQERDTGPAVQFSAEPTIKVRIVGPVQSCSLQGSAALIARASGGGRTVTVMPPVQVKMSPAGITVASAQGAPAVFGAGQDVEFTLASNPAGRVQSVETARVSLPGSGGGVGVPGVITVRGDWAAGGSGGANFDVIAEMGVETYLPGVVAREMYASWPQGAYEMQAVASRSYALHEQQRARATGRGYDIDSAAASNQAFGGLAASATVIAAVEATRGQALSDGSGDILRAYFSSCNGGRAASAADVWPTGTGFEYNLAGPLQATKKPDYSMQSPKARWVVKRSTDDVSKRLRMWADSSGQGLRMLGRVRSIEVSKRNEAERPRKFKITDDRGQTFELGAELMRQALNHPAAGGVAITDGNRVWSSDMEFKVTATDVTIQGRGFGHGVGMCQWSAKAMAEGGLSWRQMAAHFYPGSGVRKVY
jgi:stage II sporulation protein D